MFYSLYNLPEKEFKYLKTIFKNYEKIISPIMEKENFFLNNDFNSDEYLGLDYLYEDSIFMGNIGLSYDENNSILSKPLISFYVTKAYDLNNIRYFKSEQVLSEIELLNNNLEDYINICLKFYKTLSKESLEPQIPIN